MNELVPILAISMTGAILIIGMIGVFVIVAVKSFRGGGKRTPESDASESRMIQELHHGLSRMEERIDVLETLLLDRVERPKSGARPDAEDR
jgi:phage shock protein B